MKESKRRIKEWNRKVKWNKKRKQKSEKDKNKREKTRIRMKEILSTPKLELRIFFSLSESSNCYSLIKIIEAIFLKSLYSVWLNLWHFPWFLLGFFLSLLSFPTPDPVHYFRLQFLTEQSLNLIQNVFLYIFCR